MTDWAWVAASYDAVADKYDARFDDELAAKPRDRELLEAFAGAVVDPVLEVGCGPGQVGRLLEQHGRRVVGFDLSPAMAHLAARRLHGAIIGDMRALPIRERSLGGLLAFYSVIHVRRAELPVVLGEFHRVLREGGRVLVSAHEGEGEVERDEFLDEPVPIAATLFGLDELADAGRAAGLDVTHAERRLPYTAESTVRLYVEAQRP